MLLYPETNLPFNPSPATFIGCFDIYDREETLGYELNKYDPNNLKDLKILAKKAVDDTDWFRQKSYKYAWLLVSSLEEALSNDDYDFRVLFEDDYDDCISFPSKWDIKDPRVFFEEILKVAKEEWKDDLEKASKEDPSTW